MGDGLNTAASSCAAFRRDIPLLVTESLGAEEQARLELHLNGCPTCQDLYVAHQEVLESVKNSSLPDSPVDQEKILKALRKRMAVESRESVVPSQAAISRNSSILFLGLMVVAVISVLVGLSSIVDTGDPRGPGQGSGLQPLKPRSIATLTSPEDPAGREVFEGDQLEIEAAGSRLRLAKGVEVRLRRGVKLQLISQDVIRIDRGLAAFNVSRERALKVQVERGLAEVVPGSDARFSMEVKTEAVSGCCLAVDSGQVKWKGESGSEQVVQAGQASRLSADGMAVEAWRIDPKAVFGWVMEHSSRFLVFEWVTGDTSEASPWPRKAVLALRNTGDHPLRVERYSALGSHFQLEMRLKGHDNSEFTKVSPVAIRRRVTPDRAEDVGSTRGRLVLEPGQSYELELDIQGALKGKDALAVLGHYTDDGSEGGLDGSGWGFVKRTSPLERQR